MNTDTRNHAVGFTSVLRFIHGTNSSTVVNRLDRLTSGLMILPLSSASANKLAAEFASGQVRKEYIARVLGEFPKYVHLASSNN